MHLGLKGKRALILGSSRGLGLGIAQQLLVEGADVAICGRDKKFILNKASDLSNQLTNKMRGYELDLTKPSSVSNLIEVTKKDFGGFDIVVNNGGGPPPGAIAEAELEIFEKHFRPMVLSQIEITNAFLIGMRQRKWGRVLIISSSGTVQPIAGLGISNTLRLSLVGWTKTLSAEVAADGVTVNVILPGRIHTSRVDQIDAAAADKQGTTIEEIIKASKATIPAGRYGTVEEFSNVATFLLSECASYVTGSLVRVDGGYIRSV